MSHKKGEANMDLEYCGNLFNVDFNFIRTYNPPEKEGGFEVPHTGENFVEVEITKIVRYSGDELVPVVLSETEKEIIEEQLTARMWKIES
jgi:hypothetical protein